MTVCLSGPRKKRVGWARAGKIAQHERWGGPLSKLTDKVDWRWNGLQRETGTQKFLGARQACHSLNVNSINMHTLIQARRGGKTEGNLASICALSPQCHALPARDKTSQICKDHRWLQHGNMAALLSVGDVSHLISSLIKHSLPYTNTGPER